MRPWSVIARFYGPYCVARLTIAFTFTNSDGPSTISSSATASASASSSAVFVFPVRIRRLVAAAGAVRGGFSAVVAAGDDAGVADVAASVRDWRG